ncbi:MAG TPA: hypothetical protein VKM54_03545 [Myxococcota bacterium]|nr:hypothetical protein [Myxococcota bacterium]
MTPEDLKALAEIMKTGELTTREFRQLAQEFLSPVLQAAGERLADLIWPNRVENAARVFVRAYMILREAGIPLQPVPLKLLARITEGASLEEEEGLTERWARLLATAASGVDVPPSFPTILAELRATDALILDRIASRWPSPLAGGRRDNYVVDTDQPNLGALQTEVYLPEDAFRVSIDILLRLRLIVLSSLNLDDLSNRPVLLRHYQVPDLTDLGMEFVLACAGPRGAG